MNRSEKLLSAFSEDYFFKELVLDDLWFSLPNSNRVELADLLINLGDVVVAIQLKERNEENQTENLEEETKWLVDRGKVAKKQVKQTLEHIASGNLPAFSNKREQSVRLSPYATVIPLVVFENRCISEYPHLLWKHSESGMNINCMSFDDYCEMCRVLVTPMEIVEYLEYRRKIYEEHGEVDIMFLDSVDDTLVFTKPRKREALVHHFLIEKYGVKESDKQKLPIQIFRNYLHLFPERTVNSSSENATYNVLCFLAHLQRFEIAEFWVAYKATIDEAKQNATGIRHSLRNELSNYAIVFVANGLIQQAELLPIIHEKADPERVLEIEIHWIDEENYGVDFLYWDRTM